MRKWKWFVLTGSMVASLSMLAGCEAYYETNVNGERHRHEYDEDEGGFVEVSLDDDETNESGSGKKEDTNKDDNGKEENGKEENGKDDDGKDDSGKESNDPVHVSDASGYDTSDEVIMALWKGYANCSKEQLYSCFMDENVVSEKAFERISEDVDSQYEVSLSIKDTVVFHTDKISVDSESIDPEDLPSHVTKIADVDSAYVSEVVIPITQTINGADYEVNDIYEIYTIEVNGKWYVDSLAETGADLVSQSGTADTSDWCTFETDKTGIKVVYVNGMDDSCEIATGVTFDDICDALEKNSSEFNRETFRQIMTLSFGPDSYLELLQQSTISGKAHSMALLAEIAHAVDKVDGTATEMTAEFNNPTASVFFITTPKYGECTLYADGSTGDMKLTQTETGNESTGKLKAEDVAVWEEIIKDVLSGM